MDDTPLYTDDDNTIVLQVQLGRLSLGERSRMHQRFGRFYSEAHSMIMYPVSCDAHGYDVYRDEFEHGPIKVHMASVIHLPYGPDAFVPFEDIEESAGTELGQFDPSVGVWE